MQLFTKWLNEKLKEDNIDYLKLLASYRSCQTTLLKSLKF